MLFAAVMVISSFLCFSAIMKILKDIMELRDNPCKYSFFTVMITNMWDTVLCIVCFIYAFKDQVKLVWLRNRLCYLSSQHFFYACSSLIFSQGWWSSYSKTSLTTTSISEGCCAVSIYSTMVASSAFIPFLCWLTSIGSSSLEWAVCCFHKFTPMVSLISDLTSLLHIISNIYLVDSSLLYLHKHVALSQSEPVQYLRLTAWLHPLRALHTSHWHSGTIVDIQFGLLFAQQLYGNKKVMPSFLLEPVFDYKLEEEFNIEEGG